MGGAISKIEDIDKVLAGASKYSSQEYWGVSGGFSSYIVARQSYLTGYPSSVVVCSSFREMENAYTDLSFYLGESRVRRFPHWECLPYDETSPEKKTVSERLKTLHDVATTPGLIVVTTVQAYYNKTIPPSEVPGLFFDIRKDSEYPRQELLPKLVSFGYTRVDQVEEQGEFSVRGDIVDIFVAGEDKPFRIDFFDELVERIKVFDPESQRSEAEVDAIMLVSGSEVCLDTPKIERAKHYLSENRRDIDPLIYKMVRESIDEGRQFPGIESVMPIFFGGLFYLNDHFIEKPNVYFGNVEKAANAHQEIYEEIAQELELALKQRKIIPRLEHFFLPPKSSQPKPESAHLALMHQGFPADGSEADCIAFTSASNELLANEFVDKENALMAPSLKTLNALKQLQQSGSQIYVAVERENNLSAILSYFDDNEIGYEVVESMTNLFPEMTKRSSGRAVVFKTSCWQGFRLLGDAPGSGLCLVTCNEIYGVDRKRAPKSRKSMRKILEAMEKISDGDYVVHEDYGIGIFKGLTKLSIEAGVEDYLVIEYRGGDKIYLPVDKAYLLTKYSGVTGSTPHLNSLNDKSWEKVRARATKKVQDIAEELVQLYAARKALDGVSFNSTQPMLKEFEMRFPYMETEDQQRTIEEVYEDMALTAPMDRLVCGDVGFGKTEVALRAACKAVLEGYQVAILVPTTVLAAQHYETFLGRFSFLPVNIKVLNRLNGSKDTKEILSGISEGKVDILIGTHRILSKDVIFKKLGLLVIDEEQRFGVKDKEKIRHLKHNVDTLTLTATPIPRTLHMSLMGIRDISIINTPPVDRRTIKTRVLKYNTHVIAEAIEREQRRGGQVLFIHNRVEDIHLVRDELQALAPNIEFRVAHGRMKPKELETVMLDFFHNSFTALVSTTIVESGLDITNANTIIVNRADRFGLAQLYQIRGRVGRSSRQAYAYFMIAGEDMISETALKRLNVLKELTELGSGFKIASYDMEIRGAGNLLGAEQSGEIDGVGINLYMAMIEDAVTRIKGGLADEQIDAGRISIDSEFPAYVPDSYVQDMNTRLEVYRSINDAAVSGEVSALRASLEDRFGDLPPEVDNLLGITRIKHRAAGICVDSIKISPKEIGLKFNGNFSPDMERLMKLLQSSKGRIRPGNEVTIPLDILRPEESLPVLESFSRLVATESAPAEI